MVWAWGAWRAKKFAKIFDRLYAFFDFEAPYFTKHGLTTIAVGHPIADGLTPPLRGSRRAEGDAVGGQKNIALIPGSRMSEVKKLLPIMREVAECLSLPLTGSQTSAADSPSRGEWQDSAGHELRHPPLEGGSKNAKHFSGRGQYKFFIPVVETTREYIENEIKNWRVKPTIVPAARRYELYAKTHTAVCASGTATAELAIMHVPAVVVYKMNPVTQFFGNIMIKTKWSALVNIIANREIYPEFIGGAATAENIVAAVRKLDAPAARKKMISELTAADKLWKRGDKSPAKLIADDILKTVG
jgi:lipid-A-disaccharide synthase